MYIYIAINKYNNKVYVGQTTLTVEQRMRKHFSEAKCESLGKRKPSYFHNAIRKYGQDAFDFFEIDSANTIEELDKKEKYWISALNTNDKKFGYNLDAGGKSNYTRSQSTIDKLRKSTLNLHAESESYRQSSLKGLKKGTESWKGICQSRRILFVCPVCKKELYLPPHIANQRTYCSNECSKIGNREVSIAHAKLATEASMKNKQKQNKEIATELIKWAESNRIIILNCPFNKISTNLECMRSHVESMFGIKDWRTIGEAVGCRYKKDLLQYLKNHLNENICCSSPN